MLMFGIVIKPTLTSEEVFITSVLARMIWKNKFNVFTDIKLTVPQMNIWRK